MAGLRRLRSAWKRNSGWGFVQLAAKNLLYYLGALLSGRWLRGSDEAVSAFDSEHGTDTDRISEIGSLDVDSESARHAVRYQPSPHTLAATVIDGLNIDHERFAFLDFGAGKGRVLLLAAKWPFAAVVGIEFSRQLCDIANGNIAKLPPQQRRARRVECHYGDVTTCDLPRSALVCYFYNPFDEVIMQQVANRLSASLAESPRDAYVIYVHPEHRSVFDASAWEVVEEGKFHVTYRSRQDWMKRVTP